MVGQTCLFNNQSEWSVLNRFGWATKKEQWKVAQPLPQPKARNLETCSGQVNEQDDCMFLKLPGEIRNLIYEYLFRPCWGIVEVPTFQEEETTPNISSPRVSFSVGRRASQDSQRDTSSGRLSLSMTAKSKPAGPVHPLSFLLTCRKINMEASVFAFKVHPFLLSPRITTFYFLHQKSQILPRLLFESITHLAFDLGDPSRNSASDFLTNSILLFPAVKTLDIVVERSAIRPSIAHPNGIEINPPQDLYDDAVRRYVPIWLRSALKNTTDGHSFAWQKGEKWQIEYGLFDSESFLVSECYNTHTEQSMTRGFVESDFIDKVEGLVACACRCGQPNWVTAKLVQETGRTVDVKAVFLKPKERIVDSTGFKVKLIPHVEPLPVEVVQHGSGIIWGGNEDFWIDARARKGDLRAMIQSFWRSKKDQIASGTEERGRALGSNDIVGATTVSWSWVSGRMSDIDWRWIYGGAENSSNFLDRRGVL